MLLFLATHLVEARFEEALLGEPLRVQTLQLLRVHRLQARQPGRYRALCAEFCGTGHTQMMITVEVHTPEGYRQILETLEDVDPARIGRHRQTGALP